MTRRLFALERYDRSGVDSQSASLAPLALLTTARTRLVAAVRLPTDEVVLALVTGPDLETVAAVAMAAGWRVDRLITATWIFPEEDPRPAAP